MLHIFHQRDWSIEGSPFVLELKRLGTPHRVFNAPLSLRYKSRRELFTRIYPTLAWNTLRLGIRSMARSTPAPDTILVSTDIEAVLAGLVRRLLRKRTRIVMQNLIITPRRTRAQNRLYMAYWHCILASIDLGICHAFSEVESYRRLFPRYAHKFVHVPYGTTVAYEPTRAQPASQPVIVAAGRSGRDYPTLAKAVDGLPCTLKIICDTQTPVAELEPSPQIEVLTACFGTDYLQTLATATMVVVPLDVDDISAGQMVYLQAAALGRPVILTETSTTTEYVTDGVNALLVPRRDVPALRAAIQRLLTDPAFAARLGEAAQLHFKARHSTEAYVRNVVAALHQPGSDDPLAINAS